MDRNRLPIRNRARHPKLNLARKAFANRLSWGNFQTTPAPTPISALPQRPAIRPSGRSIRAESKRAQPKLTDLARKPQLSRMNRRGYHTMLRGTTTTPMLNRPFWASIRTTRKTPRARRAMIMTIVVFSIDRNVGVVAIRLPQPARSKSPSPFTMESSKLFSLTVRRVHLNLLL